MKVISLLQPWATLVVIGAKKIETRSWNTKYRGELLIHASAGKKPYTRRMAMDFQQEFFSLQLPKFEKLPFGAIIGKVNLIDTIDSDIIGTIKSGGVTHSSGNSWKFTDQEKTFGDYSPNRFGWLLSDPVEFKKPIPFKGQLGIRDVPESIMDQLKDIKMIMH